LSACISNEVRPAYTARHHGSLTHKSNEPNNFIGPVANRSHLSRFQKLGRSKTGQVLALEISFNFPEAVDRWSAIARTT
jgi:hypothetical protein